MNNFSILVFGENISDNEFIADKILEYLGAGISHKYSFEHILTSNSLTETDYSEIIDCINEYINSGNHYKFCSICTFKNTEKENISKIDSTVLVYVNFKRKEKINDVIEITSKTLPTILLTYLDHFASKL